ncbi:MAG: orotate phosphoribosyltransferase [Chloroflexi bacterium]|nr:MAG: orotate phosphoribosyltransferase [Chloroflexota bacterium]
MSGQTLPASCATGLWPSLRTQDCLTSVTSLCGRGGRRSMSEQLAIEAFERSGAWLKGHFVYTSGRHGADYLEKFRILEDPVATTALAGLIAARFRDSEVELVAGPTTGGIILAFEVARQLGVQAVYAERGPTDGWVLRRGFAVGSGTRVLIVDDIVTTGGSLEEMVACIETAGGSVIGAGVLGDRTGGFRRLAVPFYACLTVEFPSYPASACPLCRAGTPLSAPRGSKPSPAAV